LLITCKCTPLCKKQDYDAKSDPPYVDNFLITSDNLERIEWLESQLQKNFEMMNPSDMSYYLIIEFLYLEKIFHDKKKLHNQDVGAIWNVQLQSKFHTNGGKDQITNIHGLSTC